MWNTLRLPFPVARITVMLCGAGVLQGAPVIVDFAPKSGPGGTVITVQGSGFGTNEDAVTARVGSTAATVTGVADAAVQITAPAVSGLIEISLNGVAAPSLQPFSASRTITGSFVPPPGLDATGYFTGKLTGASSGPDFSVTVSKDQTEIVWAWRTASDPTFAALVLPGAGSVQIDAASTTVALVALSPVAPKGDPVAVSEFLARMTGTAELAAVTGLIQQAAAGGYDYADDGRFDNAYADLLVRAFAPPGPPGAPRQRRDFVHPGTGLVEAVLPENAIADARLSYRLEAKPGAQLLTVSPSATDPTRLHQNLDLWRVSPDSFPAGFIDVEGMNITDQLTLLDNAPYGSGFVPDELGSSNLDPNKWISKGMGYLLDGATGTAATDGQFAMPSYRPGVYVLNAFSGNVWFGSNRIDPGRTQRPLISQTDPNYQWALACGANFLIAGVDVASVILPDIKFLSRKDLGKVVKSVGKDVTKIVLEYLSSSGDLDLDAAVAIGKTTAKAILKGVTGALASDGADLKGESLNGFLGSAAKILGTVFKGMSKLSAVLQALERGASLIIPTHYAVERAIVVIGDPFVARIRSFTPASGRAGEVLTVFGEDLPSSASGFRINFAKFASTGSPPTINARLPATIVSTNGGNWVIRMPNASDWDLIFGPGHHDVFLTLEKIATGNETSTRENRSPNSLFSYRAPPQITAVTPNPVRPGGIIGLVGPDIDPIADTQTDIEIDGAGASPNFSNTSGRMFVKLEANIAPGPHTIRIVFRNSATYAIVGASNVLPFTVVDPYPPPVGSQIRGLRVNRLDFSNIRDGDLSLYEAMKLASGDQPLNIRPQGQAGGRYESDQVTLPSGGNYGNGAAIRDSISIASEATGGPTIMLSGPVPPPGNGDFFSLTAAITFDGSGAPPGTVGWDLSGVSGLQFSGGKFQNFTGGGLLFRNGAHFNRFSGTSIDHCGGDGLAITGDATGNRLHALIIRDAGGVGVRLSGPGVTGNQLTSDTAIGLFGNPPAAMRVFDADDHGILIEGGAHANFVDIWEVRGSGGDGIRLTGAGTTGNIVGAHYLPGTRDIAGNSGHGVHILDGARDTVVMNLSASGNAGDGFRIDGSTGNLFHGIATGFDFAAGATPAFISRNTGYSIHIRESAGNLIGTTVRGPFINVPVCNLGGSSAGATVFITGAGSHHNTINSAAFGHIDVFNAPLNATPEQRLAPAATHAIHLTGGAHDNVIGHGSRDLDIVILATPNGSGVCIDGAGTDRNHVLGTTFGLLRTDIPLAGQHVKTGIHVLDGARDNRIGESGNNALQDFRPYNAFGNIVEAAIRLENVNSDIDVAGETVGANRLINNRFGFISTGGPALHPEVGIHLKGQVTGQWIGGLVRGDGNQVSRFGFAGLWIEGGIIPDYARRNRVIGFWTSVGVGSSGSVNTDPFAGPVASHPLLVSGGASGQVIGEEWPLNNQFSGGRVCAYLDGGSNNWIRATWMDSGLRGGLFMRNGTGHRIGGARGDEFVRFTRGGTVGDDDTAGIVIAGGGSHSIRGAVIGDYGSVDTIWGSKGHGILIHNSSGNRIGGPVKGDGNLIVRSGGDGIVIRGAASFGNEIGNNRIGFGTPKSPNPGNAGSGVRLSGGAHDNVVGGDQIPWGQPAFPPVAAPNSIRGNTGDGVRVTDAGTVDNRILGNSITGNGGLGIRIQAAGNRLQPPPAGFVLTKGRIEGQVALATTPPGSTIEVFMNPAGLNPEGESFFASGTVAADGKFSLTPAIWPVGAVITATATHFVTGDTSEFTTGTILPPSFGFALAVPQGESLVTHPWPNGLPFSAVVLTASSENSTVEVTNLHVRAIGTGGFAAALAGVSLFEDVDFNGVWSVPDRELAPPAAFDAGTLTAILSVRGALVGPDETRRWVLRLHPAPGVSPAGTVRLEIANAAALGEFYREPLGMTGVQAVFPLHTAQFQAGMTDPRAAWRSSFGLPSDGTGAGADHADPDFDGLVNILEYALGSSPVNSKDAARPLLARQTGPDRLTLSYQRLRDDITYTVQTSPGTGGWTANGVDQGSPGPAVTASVPITGLRALLRLVVGPR